MEIGKVTLFWGEKMDLKDIVNFFCNTQTTKEAFLKGVLYGYGAHSACPIPDWEMLKEAPEIFVEIERGMREMFEIVHKDDIKKAKRLLIELQATK